MEDTLSEDTLNCISFITSLSLRCDRAASTDFVTQFLAAGGEVSEIRFSCCFLGSFPQLLRPCEQIRDSHAVSSVVFDRIRGGLSPDAVRSISTCKSNKESINELSLTFVAMNSAAEVKELLAPPLTRLRLVGNNRQSAGDIIRGLSAATTLRSLSLEGNNLGPEELRTLTSYRGLWEQLEELTIRSECAGVDEGRIIGAAWARARHCRLRKFLISGVSGAALAAIIEGLRKSGGILLKDFSMLFCSIKTPKVGTAAEGEVARLFWTVPMECIDVSNNLFCDSVAIGNSLAGQARSLRVLDIRSCGLNSEAIGAVCRALVPGVLTTLRISDNYSIGDLGAKSVADLLAAGRLEELDMCACAISQVGALHLAAGLAKNCTLRSLDLRMNSAIGGKAAAALLDAFPAGHPIEVLDMTCCNIEDPGAEALGRLIGREKWMRAISVSKNGITAAGFAVMMAGENTRSIETLSTGLNTLGAIGAKCIANAIVGWGSLRELDIQWIEMGKEGALTIARAIAARKDPMRSIYAREYNWTPEEHLILKKAYDKAGIGLTLS